MTERKETINSIREKQGFEPMQAPMPEELVIRFAGKVKEIQLSHDSKEITFNHLALLRDLYKLSELVDSSAVEITIRPIKRVR